ncbi:hypothetical protein [Lacibacter sediminis]|uniref:Nuclear transport factor 2 family protein n=1 Tax=Lacibacter sediminis TaxID=2760713 RepID=A0A7G5XGR1_9BACT|nr:hypothetical protein [Lacibacter sediminis]QNA44664.1 hypothetical protein H4075_00260 [Lacibacter sediminis]
MKHVFLVAAIIGLMLACNNETEKPADAATTTSTAATPTDLPYTASYSSEWDTNVSDADVKTVLTSYKDWADGNMDGLMAAIADSIWVDRWDGHSANYAKADLQKMWALSRDSLSSVQIEMEAWHKMRSVKQKDSIIVVWYKQIDTYKDGRIDSARWHDINMVKGGKLVWYSQYRRPLK